MTLTLMEPTAAGHLGCPPRFSTPRNFDRLTLGHLVGEIARRLGTPLMPWQQFVADVALEYDANGFCYDEVDILVPRQSGKTTLIVSKTLMRLILMVRSHGPQRSTYVAQKRLDARRKFERDFAPLLRKAKRSFPEVAHARQRPTGDTEWRLGLNNGSEALEFGTGSWWQVGVPDDSGGHGDTLDDYTIDEARFQEDATVEEGLGPSMITRADAQGWVVSTAGTAGNQTGAGQRQANSVYLYRKVLAGRAACESGDHGRVAYFEWSAPDTASTIADWGNPDVWRQCMPALGHTIPLRRIEAEWEKALRGGQDGIDNFRRAYLNQWPHVPVMPEENTDQVLDAVAWEACKDPGSGPGEPLRLALDVAADRRWAAFAVAGPARAGGTHIEVADYRAGTDWVVPRAVELQERWGGPLYVAEKSPASALVTDLVAADVEVQLVKLEEHAEACGNLFDAVLERRVRHLGEPVLQGAVRAAKQRSYGDAWLWSRRKSGDDICPLVAVTLAYWAIQQPAPNGGWMVSLT